MVHMGQRGRIGTSALQFDIASGGGLELDPDAQSEDAMSDTGKDSHRTPGNGHARKGQPAQANTAPKAIVRPDRMLSHDRLDGHHKRRSSAPSPPLPELTGFKSAPIVPTINSPAPDNPPPLLPLPSTFPGPSSPVADLADARRVLLSLYTYTPTATSGREASQLNTVSLLPAPAANLSSSRIQLNYASLPWTVKPGDYLEIRRAAVPTLPVRPSLTPVVKHDRSTEADALEGVRPDKGRDGYIFRLGDDVPSVPINQIQVPNQVAQSFKLQHRADVEVIRVSEPETAYVDFIELHFSQYVGRADMWRLGMSLENTTVHVGEKVTLAGGAVRVDVSGIWRGRHRFSSGIVTSKTKTIFRSKSAQTYIFIQLARETWEFDEDGERYYEKVLHGFLPELFQRWSAVGASHLVTIVFFGRVMYDDDEVDYLRRLDLTTGLIKDCRGRWCKDFFRVVVDFERRADWMPMLADIKKQFEKSEREVLLDFHLFQLAGRKADEEKLRIVGDWSFAYEGNILEAINLALNPFDEHYIDRDLSRTGLSMTVLTPGTGHFAVDRNLLRLTTERMIDHGCGLDLVCLTKMPLHSVPLFSYQFERPKRQASDDPVDDDKTKPSTPDPLYFDANLTKVEELETIECYSLAFWVYCSYYSKTHDKPFRRDRFVPRCKMYEIQMLGILDHNMTTVIVPLLEDAEVTDQSNRNLTSDDRKLLHEDYDRGLFTGGRAAIDRPDAACSPPNDSQGTSRGGTSAAPSSSLGASFQSSRGMHHRSDDDKRLSTRSTSPRPIPSRGSVISHSSIVEESTSNPSLPEEVTGPLGAGSADMPDMPVIRKSAPLPTPSRRADHRYVSDNGTPSFNVSEHRTPSSRVISMPAMTSTGTSPTQSVASTDQIPSGASTPKGGSVRRLKNQASKGSFASRFASTWLFGALGVRSQPSFPTAANETVERQDVSTSFSSSKPSSPATRQTSLPPATVAQPVRVPGSPALPPTKAKAVPKLPTQPMPILSQAARVYDEENHPLARSMPRSMPRSIPRSLQQSLRAARSVDDSWRNKANAAFGRTQQHTTVNPCNPMETVYDNTGGHLRRWQHVRPKMTATRQHVVKWRSLCVPACLPLTTDFMPNPEELATYYEAHSYDIACFPDQVSFLIRPDAANLNLPLAVMREMASQRLSQNFQFIVLPHTTGKKGGAKTTPALQKTLLFGETMDVGLRVGGASEVLKDASGAIYLSWSNHVHRLSFDPQKQSVTVQRFVRKIRHSTAEHSYKCLVWPYQLPGYQEASAVFRYPNIDAKLNFNYLDRLIAGEEDRLQPNLRFWRTRYILIPSGREPTSVAGLMPKGSQGEQYNQSEILITGAMKVLELIGRYQWKRQGEAPKTLRLLATTFDPSTCVLDEGLMGELERLTSGKEKIDTGHTLEGLTLQAVADMMNKPNNGLIIRDRWWNFNVHEDSFTGEQFTEWLRATFSDIPTREQAVEWGQSLFEKGLIEHVTGEHAFHDTYFFYRLRAQYDPTAKRKSTKHSKGWFSKATEQSPLTVIAEHTAGSPSTRNAPLKLGDRPAKKRKIKMSQSIVIDLDPHKKSDRAEVAILHADIVHNSKNAFHFELNWLGVTAGLLDELRAKCSTLAERYGLRFVEAPVEQTKDLAQKCAYRAPIPIRLALPPPIIPDLHLRLTENSGSGQWANYFEYAILTQKFGFVLDLEATERYPETIEVEYAYRSKAKFEYSQFCHRSGLALVQCIGREEGFLWADNRPFISSPTRGRTQSLETFGGNAASTPMGSRQEQARTLREEMEAFCSDPVALAHFYQDVTPPPPPDNVPETPVVKDKKELAVYLDDAWAGGYMSE